MALAFARDPAVAQTRRDVFRVAWPAVVEQLLVTLVGMVSLAFVGRLGSGAQGGVGLVNMLVNFTQAVFAAMSTGCIVVVARLTGEQDRPGAESAPAQAVSLATASALVMTAACLVFQDLILRTLIGADNPEIALPAREYYTHSMLSLPFMIYSLVVGASFRGVGDMRTPMIISLIVNVINIGASLPLIFGFGPIPAMGVRGAGLAVLLARSGGAAIISIPLFTGGGRMRLHRPSFRPDFKMIARVMRVGVPAAVEQIVLQGGFLMMTVIVTALPMPSPAVYQITNNINGLANTFNWGIAAAATAIVGQRLGAKDYDGAMRSATQILWIAEASVMVLAVACVALARQIIPLFNTEPDLQSLAVITVRIMVGSAPLQCVLSAVSATLRGAGDINYVTATSIVGVWVFRVILAQVFIMLGWGLVGVYIAMVIDYSVRSLMYWIRFKRGNWLYIKV